MTMYTNSVMLNITIMITMSLYMMTIKSTSIMCLMLFSHTINTCVIVSKLNPNTPMPFIIFLTIIGGLMILFMYFTSMMKNNKPITMNLSPLNMMMSILALILMTKMLKNLPMNPSITKANMMLKHNFNKTTLILIMFLTLILMLTIKTYSKANSPFRRKLKIWNSKKNF